MFLIIHLTCNYNCAANIYIIYKLNSVYTSSDLWANEISRGFGFFTRFHSFPDLQMENLVISRCLNLEKHSRRIGEPLCI